MWYASVFSVRVGVLCCSEERMWLASMAFKLWCILNNIESLAWSLLWESVDQESLEHSSDTVSAAIFVESKPCCTTLDHLKFFGEMISVRVPYRTAVLQKWPDKRLVGVSFHKNLDGGCWDCDEENSECYLPWQQLNPHVYPSEDRRTTGSTCLSQRRSLDTVRPRYFTLLSCCNCHMSDQQS